MVCDVTPGPAVAILQLWGKTAQGKTDPLSMNQQTWKELTPRWLCGSSLRTSLPPTFFFHEIIKQFLLFGPHWVGLLAAQSSLMDAAATRHFQARVQAIEAPVHCRPSSPVFLCWPWACTECIRFRAVSNAFSICVEWSQSGRWALC